MSRTVKGQGGPGTEPVRGGHALGRPGDGQAPVGSDLRPRRVLVAGQLGHPKRGCEGEEGCRQDNQQDEPGD
jgi:hypothetical protein